jgi:glycerol kinase
LDTAVVRPEITETTAMGAAYLAGLAVGFWQTVEEIQQQWKVNRRFTPAASNNRDERIKGWAKAIKACEVFASAD